MTTDWMIRGNVRLTVERLDDGWGWRAWECLTKEGWQPLRPPAPQNTLRRFTTQSGAEAFFLLLSEFIAESARARHADRVTSPTRPLNR